MSLGRSRRCGEPVPGCDQPIGRRPLRPDGAARPRRGAGARGQYDQAINTFKELAQRKDGPLPIDGILMQLGRTYLDAGKRADAEQTFNRLVEEFPASPYTTDARRELDTLKKT